MNKLIVAFAVLLMMVACGEKSNFSVSGTIEEGAGKMIYLSKLGVSSQMVVDSVKLDKKGTFEFEGLVHQPSFYLLKVNDRNFVTLLVDSTESITVAGTYQNLARDYQVEGSLGSKMVQELETRFAKAKSELAELRGKYTKHKGDKAYAEQLKTWAEEYESIYNGYSEYAIEFVQANPFSLASVMALYQQWQPNDFVVKDLHTMKVAASALSAMFPNSEHVRSLHTNTVDLMRRENNMKLNTIMQQQAVNSPDIVLPDVNGKEVALSSLAGKTVLVQFWSAQDRGSRILNPVLVENYKKFKRKGFEIYMVSVDTNKDLWQQAIKQDKLSWINVCDLKGSVKAVNNYNVRVLPYNYLLDGEGRILAKDLKGPALNKALSTVLK